MDMSTVGSQRVVEALEKDTEMEKLDRQRDQFLDKNPDHGEIVNLGDNKILYQSSGKPEGANLFIYGEIKEHPPTQEKILSEVGEGIVQRLENYFRIKHGNRELDVDVETADYKPIGEHDSVDYLKLNEVF
jgi:calcineurin-like phosphoesterase family protein